MKKVFRIFRLEEKKVCTPSEDYYARGGDWSQDEIRIMYPLTGDFDKEEEAERELETYDKGEYVILPVYIKK